jgi:hypothetical protein
MTFDQACEAYRIGLERLKAAKKRKGRHRFDWTPTESTERHYQGMSAISESLGSLQTNRRWISQGLVPDRKKDGDLEGGIGVRWTWRESGRLIVHEDQTNVGELLVVGPRFPLRVVGWYPVPDAMRPEWWDTKQRRPAFFVPQEELRDWRELVLVDAELTDQAIRWGFR